MGWRAMLCTEKANKILQQDDDVQGQQHMGDSTL
jgi:hypothetical protein